VSRSIPPLVHVRPAGRPSSGPGIEDVSARTMPVDALRRELQGGGMPRDTEVLFAGLGDWTAASEIPELWIAPVHEPVPAEEHEHDPTAPSIPISSTSAAPRRRSFGALAVVGTVGAALALLGIGAGAIYWRYFHYEPVAARHLPRRCVVAARGNVWDVGRFEPLVKKLIPAIEDATRPPPPPGPPPPAGPSLEERLKAQAGIDLSRGEVHEVAACLFEDKTLPSGVKDPALGYRVVVAIGGKFKPGIIPGLFEALRPELAPLAPRIDGAGESAVIRVLPSPASLGLGFVVGQAEDGTVLVTMSDASLAAAREQRSEDEARETTGLRQQGSLELSIDHLVFSSVFKLELLGGPPAGWDGIFKALGDVSQGHLAVTMTKTPKVEVSLEQKTETSAKEAEAAMRKFLELTNGELATVPKDWAGEHAALGGGRVRRDDTRVDLILDFRYPDVDRGAGELGEQIKDPASLFRKKTWPVLAWKIGVGPKPASSAAPATSASGSPSAHPPIPPPEDD